MVLGFPGWTKWDPHEGRQEYGFTFRPSVHPILRTARRRVMGKLAEILTHPDEFLPMLRMYLVAKSVQKLPKDPDLAFCFTILNSVSRSFSVVIHQLPDELRDVVCVFYLVLRALDTVEDDMHIPVSEKVPLLRAFHERIRDPSFCLDYGTDHYQRLLREFPKVNRILLSFSATQQEVICDITKRMGEGMADFIEKEVETVAEYDTYCFYVAGLVGVGLSKLFAYSKLETAKIVLETEHSRHMGLFLQKTNIIRDYLEDIMEEPRPRMFWPKEIWHLYAEKLEDFKRPSHRAKALQCLNHLITDSLHHVPFCFEYLKELQTKDVFRFCAIPQVMAIATAAVCFDNGGVFEGVVKVRRGETCKVFQDVQSMADVYRLFHAYAERIAKKIPSAEMDIQIRRVASKKVEEIQKLCAAELGSHSPSSQITMSGIIVLALLFIFLGIFIRFLYNPETDKLHSHEF